MKKKNRYEKASEAYTQRQLVLNRVCLSILLIVLLYLKAANIRVGLLPDVFYQINNVQFALCILAAVAITLTFIEPMIIKKTADVTTKIEDKYENYINKQQNKKNNKTKKNRK